MDTGNSLTRLTARVLGRLAEIFSWPIIVLGIDPSGAAVPLGASAAVAATGTLTSDNTAPSDGDTVTIGLHTYTFRTALTASTTKNEVLINGTADAALLNLIRAINLTGTPGTDYGSQTVQNGHVSAAAAVTSHAFAVTALAPGAAGNSVATTETSAHLSWGSTTLTGGDNPTQKTAIGGDIGAGEYETVAASQTAQVLGATGAVGDYIAGLLVIPATVGCGVVTLLDGGTSIPVFVGGGTTALPSCIPFFIPLGLKSVSGAWKVTTGANVSVIGCGNFT